MMAFALGTAWADSILVYERSAPETAGVKHTVSIVGRWLRIDSEPKQKSDYTLIDTGRMLMFDVDDANKRFYQSHVGQFYWPDVGAIRLMPVREKSSVAGLRCQKIKEMGSEKPKAEHCMSVGSALGLSERETKTLSRLFLIARRVGLDWGGVATPDERQISLSSLDLEKGASLKFLSVEHQSIPDNRMKIPNDYQPIMVETPKPRQKQKQ